MIWRNLTLGSMLLATMLAGCAAPADPPVPTLPPTLTFTPTQAPPTATPTITPSPTLPPEWVESQPGIELRQMTIPASADSDETAAIIARIDPSRFAIRIHYSPEAPARIADWQARLGAVAVINAGFFQEDFTAAGLVVTDGQAYGVSFDRNGTPLDAGEGMLVIGSSGEMALRLLLKHPYDPAEALTDAVQALPVLIRPGGQRGEFNLPNRKAWRSVVALDRQGQLLLINVSQGEITLTGLQDWLLSVAPELDLDSAMNLDGGPSSGLVVSGGIRQVSANSFSRVPSVIAVYPR